jgi:hypothetical protein
MGFQTFSITIPQCTIGQRTVTLEGNIPLAEELELSAKKIDAYCNTSASIFRVIGQLQGAIVFFKLTEKTLKLAHELEVRSVLTVVDKCTEVVTGLNLISFPSLWCKVKKSIDGLQKPDPSQAQKWRQRKWEKLALESTRAMAATGGALQTTLDFIGRNNLLPFSLKVFIRRAFFISSIVSLKMSLDDLHSINQLITESKIVSGLSDEFQSVLEQTKRRHSLAVAKNILTVLCGAIVFGTGIVEVSFLVSSSLAAAAAFFDFSSKVYEEKMRWKPIDCFSPKHIAFA